MSLDVYLYGMTVYSTLHVLGGRYPEPDSYQELSETHQIPGGEAGNAATILSNLGYKVKLDGPHLGYRTRDQVFEFYRKNGVDCSGFEYDPEFEGLQDLVLIDSESRTVFGTFGSYFSSKIRRWSQPDENAIRSARIIGIDPFFPDASQAAADFCARHAKDYVTIDCEPESRLHQNAAATVISNEYIQGRYGGVDVHDLHKWYTDQSNGLVIFTFGSREIIFGRKGGDRKSVEPYKVETVSTLGAGDSFRAGVIYGILNRKEDEFVVRFAAATAACSCSRFPLGLNPPSLDEILAFVKG